MLLVGLTGGIGSGKTTVARMLSERGAAVLDADAIVRDLQRPGTVVFRRIVERFGDEIVTPGGELDRARLAGLIFEDPAARADLNAIVHPEVWRVVASELERLGPTETVVVIDVPLLAEGDTGGLVGTVVVVEAPEDVRVDRVVRERGMDPADVRARIRAQASDEQRRTMADEVIVNDGDPDALRAQVDRLWERLNGRAR